MTVLEFSAIVHAKGCVIVVAHTSFGAMIFQASAEHVNMSNPSQITRSLKLNSFQGSKVAF